MDVPRTHIPKIDSTSTIEETVRDKTSIDPKIQDAFPRTSSQPVFDEKKLIRKIDLRLVTTLLVMYIFAFLDRSNLGNARLAGLEKNLGLHGNQFQISLAVFYIGYVLLEIPSIMVIKRFTPSKLIPSLMILWSVIICCMAAVNNFGELIATRILLGIAEAGFPPGSSFLLSMWYRRSQLAARFTIFFSGSALAGAFGGVFAYFVTGHMNGKVNLEGWRWLFLLEGLATFAISLISFFTLPNFPENTTFLNAQEKDYWVSCLRKDDGTLHDPKHHNEFTYYSLYLAVKDWKVYIAMIVGMCIATALYSISLYLPTVINSMGYDLLQSQLMTAPPYFVGWCIALAIALHSDKVKERSFHFIFGGCLALIGFLGLATMENKSLLYASTFFCTTGVTTIASIQLAWVSNIFSKPHDKRAIAQSMYTSFSNLAGVFASMLYQTSDGPKYFKAHMINASSMILAIIFTLIMRYALIYENKKMDLKTNEKMRKDVDKDDIENQDTEVSDYRYIL